MGYHLDAVIADYDFFEQRSVPYRKLRNCLLGISADVEGRGNGVDVALGPDYKGHAAHVFAGFHGGFGDQSCLVFKGKQLILNLNEEPEGKRIVPGPINQALKLMGVVRVPGMDEFDTVGLDDNRDNEWEPDTFTSADKQPVVKKLSPKSLGWVEAEKFALKMYNNGLSKSDIIELIKQVVSRKD